VAAPAGGNARRRVSLLSELLAVSLLGAALRLACRLGLVVQPGAQRAGFSDEGW